MALDKVKEELLAIWPKLLDHAKRVSKMKFKGELLGPIQALNKPWHTAPARRTGIMKVVEDPVDQVRTEITWQGNGTPRQCD